MLLNLIRRLSGIPHVHVLASCRDFEYRHDVRLTAIDATLVHLELPTWEEVAAVLARHALPQAAEWPSALHDLLRAPQHLKVFLNVLLGGSEPELFTSYQMMLERLWELRITNADGLAGRSGFLDAVATRMANEEVLWLPAIQYESQVALINQLEASGILMRASDGRSFGFSHQTLFNHARARAFVRVQHGQSFADYVLARQHALFVRPTLWSSLTYLRGADRKAFQREFGSLWAEPTLRTHVRLLLIEFLGQLEDPDNQEATWLLPRLEDNGQRGHALRAMAGKKGWFERLLSAYLPMIMGGDDPQDLKDITIFLSEAWRTSHEGVLALLQAHWSSDTEKDLFTWSTLESLREWDARTADLVCTLLKRGRVHPARVMDVVSAISAAAPKLAPQAVAVALQSKLDHVVSHLPSPPTPPDDATEEEQIVWAWKNSPIHALRKLLEDGTGWYSLIEIAEAAPSEFLQAVWPWFLQVLRLSAGPPNAVLHNYRHDAGFGIVGESPVLDAIEAAVTQLAEHKQDEFLNFVGQWAEEDLFSVQQLLMKGMEKLFSTKPQVALGFLLADARRFGVGNAFDTDRDTTTYINGLTPHLSQSQRGQLEATIKTWEPHQRITVSQKSPDERRRFAKWAREARLRLLVAMDPEHLSAETRDFVVHERRALPRALGQDITMRGGTVASPMSSDQMFKARDEDVLSLFAELTDATGWNHPRRQDFLVGGSLQAAAAFGELAKQAPGKVVSIINQLSPGTQEIPVAHALMGLAESSLPHADLVALIIELDGRGFGSENFRLYSAWALDKLIEHKYQPPDAICDLLENWLEHMQRSAQAGATKAQIDKSILWGHGNLQPLPQGTFTILQTLSRSYLTRTPVESSRWLDLLERHLSGPEDESSWIFLASLFPYLKHADHTRAVGFLRALFARHPRVRDGAAGVLFVAQIREWMEPEFERACLLAIRDSEWIGGRQAYAELLPLLAVLPAHQWAIEEIETILAATKHDESPEMTSMCIGLAYAAVNLWDNRRYRELATHILIRLLESPDADVSQVIMSVFGIVNFLPPDVSTTAFLRGALAHPHVLDSNDNTYFLERLNEILPSRPELVMDLAEMVVERVGTTPADPQAGARLPMAELVNLAMTVQRLSGDLRIRGLALFERLLALNAYEARGTLTELDNRPTFSRIATPVRRPRRPRRRRG